MRFEPERRCETMTGFVDPRESDGELLFPERFAEEQVTDLEMTMGSFAAAGQLQQRPVPRAGGLFNREWFKFLPVEPNDAIWCRGWDLAASTNHTSAFTAGVKIGKTSDGKLVIADVRRNRLSGNGVRDLIKTTAAVDNCRQSIPQDPGQAGKAQVLQFSEDLQGYDVRFSPESGDKVTRAMPISAQAEAGNVYLVEGEWNNAFVDECATFPNGKFKDQVDALSRAYSELMKLTKARPASASTFGAKIIS